MSEVTDIPFLMSRGPWEKLRWLRTQEGVSVFEGVRNGENRRVAAGFFVRREESDIWKACHDMLAESVRTASGWLQGLFGLEMIAMEMERGIQHFNPAELGKLLANHSRTLTAGESRLIQYGGLWAVFKKRVPESYGKIEFKSCVRINRQETERLDLHLKAVAREALRGLDTGMPLDVLGCDLSAAAAYDEANPAQSENLKKTTEKICTGIEGGICLESIFYRHQRKERVLWQKIHCAG